MAICKECKLFDIEAAKDKAGRVLSTRAVKCLWVSKEKYPNCVNSWTVGPEAGVTCSNWGKGCYCFQKRVN